MAKRNKLALTVLLLTTAVLLIWQASCKKIPFYAAEGATLIISSDKTYLQTNGGTAVITVLGFNAEGQALHDNTRIIFSATFGAVEPAEVDMIGGKATTTFTSGSSSGFAEIRARSGAVTAEPDPLVIVIGSAALETLAISATPQSFPAGGGRARIQVFAFDIDGNLLPNIPVVLSATSGTFEANSGVYNTGGSGMAEDYLNITQSTTVTAASAGKSAEIELTVEEEQENQTPSADFSISPTSPKKGETIYFNGSLSADPDGDIVSWKWDFGDGKTASGERVQHVYNWAAAEDKTFTIVLTVTDDSGAEAVTSKTLTVKNI